MRLVALLLFSFFIPVHTATMHTMGSAPAYWSGVQWALKAANVPAAWPIATGVGTTYCSVDTGVSPDSPDLTVSEGYNAVEPGKSWVDDNGHGTHVAGIAVGKGAMIQGVAPDAKLIVAKVLGADGSGSDASVTAGIAWCISHGATVVGISIGGDSSGYDGMAPLIRYGCRHGVDFSVAAGNEGRSDPALVPATVHSSCLVVSEASQKNGNLADFTNTHENPRTVVSPGVNILSDWLNGGTAMASGTSMSQPLTAGALLLVRSEGLSAKDAVRDILDTADRTSKNYDKSSWGWGSINVGRAVSKGRNHA